MGGKSSIAQLEEPVRVAVDAAIKRGATIDQIVLMLQGLGADVSRSAVGRYSKQYAEVARRQRELSSVARAFASEFGDAEGLEGRLLIQQATAIATRMALNQADNDDPNLSMKELMELGRAVKDITAAAKIDIEREAKIRTEAAVKARQQAASAADRAGKAAGASPETLAAIRQEILGIRG